MSLFYKEVGNNIRKYRKMRNYSLQELADKVGLTKKTIQRYEKGEIRFDVNRLGDIAEALDVEVPKLLEGARKYLGLEKEEYYPVPLIGTICAGDGLLAEQNIEDYIYYPFRSGRKPDYALRVEGNSMIGAGIEDGDIVYMRHASWADYNGQIVAALIRDRQDGVLKRIKWTADSPIIKLLSENDEYPPIEVMPNEVTICGVYMGHFKPERDV